MSGISTSIGTPIMGSFLPIVVWKERYSIPWFIFERSITDDHLLAWTGEALEAFRALERTINAVKSITLTPELCHKQLVALAKWGKIAYEEFFNDDARQMLIGRFQMMGDETPAPTFISEMVPFPWEVLYAGDDYKQGDPEMFWGLRYSLARILTPAKDITKHVLEQTALSDMLFCLHHKLRQAHQHEWPAIERLVRVTSQDCFCLLGPAGGITDVSDGETLLRLLDESKHNMVHFACHCRPGEAGADALLISLIDRDGVDVEPAVIELNTNIFVLRRGQFQLQPLVFLNACQSGGGADELRVAFNLPRKFIERGAAAVIATACPVPDLFAASFARHFYAFFLNQHMTIGEALRATRWHFLKQHHNPLGLAYGLYSPAYYRLARSPA